MLRIIDANLNRLGEGLRFLEDVARFVLNDAALTQKLRSVRHNLLENTAPFKTKLLTERDVTSDVGFREIAHTPAAGLPGLVIANAKRAEEALRVIEELAKLPEVALFLNSTRFKEARFELYGLEQKLLSQLWRKEKREKISGLYLILDIQALKGRDEVEVTKQAIRSGINILQLRDKQRTKSEILSVARKLKEICTEANILFIINDHFDLVLATNADGLHLGQSDLPVSVARQLLPRDKIIGCSVNTLDQAKKAEAEDADYIAVGSIYPTTSKEHPVVIGLERLDKIRQAISCPIVAIGGINKDNVTEVIAKGADSVAVISAVLSQEDIVKACSQIIAEINKAKLKIGKK